MADKPAALSRLRTAVIGLGRMGMHHVRACADLDGIDLCAVLDHKPDWAVQVGAETHSLVAADVDSLIGKVDIAIIAVPAADHAATAIPLLENGIACLVEKPIAADEHEAEALIAAAEKGQAALRIGHIERFNPAVLALIDAVADLSAINRVTVRRHTPAQDRSYDIDAVLDLMTHDIDLTAVFGFNEPKLVTIADGSSPENVRATINYACGRVADLSVLRGSKNPERSLVAETNDRSFVADLAQQSLQEKSAEKVSDRGVETGDALRLQLKDFIAAVNTGKARGATGDDGLAALALANRVRTAAGLTS